MPAPAPTSPVGFKEVLERFECEVVKESDYNWVLKTKEPSRPLITIPKKGDVISLSIMMSVMDMLRMDNGTYFRLKGEVEGEHGKIDVRPEK